MGKTGDGGWKRYKPTITELSEDRSRILIGFKNGRLNLAKIMRLSKFLIRLAVAYSLAQ
jgi:hypothetical protein